MELTLIENVAAVVAGDQPPETLGVKALDDRTLEVRLSKSMSYFPTLTTHTEMFPVPRRIIENLGKEWTQPGAIVSNGAYRLGENTSERIVRFRSASYWDGGNTIIDKVIAHVIDTKKAVELYNAGEMDRFDIPSGEYPALHARFPDLAISFPRLCVYYYSFNLADSGPAALKNIKVRRALSLAIDRGAITDTILQGGQTPAYTFTPPTTANFSAPPGTYGQMSQEERVALAKRLIEDAGYGQNNPLTLTLLFNKSSAHRQISEQIAQMWKDQLGVSTELSEIEWREFLDVRGRQEFEVARGGWCGDFNDPASFLELMTSKSGYNDGKFSNASVDALLDAARKTDDRAALYTGIEQILAEEMPIIPLYHYSGVYMFSRKLRNWPIENATQTWYSKDLFKVP
jgi:oligopeptide transport system substrate-binding protein